MIVPWFAHNGPMPYLPREDGKRYKLVDVDEWSNEDLAEFFPPPTPVSSSQPDSMKVADDDDDDDAEDSDAHSIDDDIIFVGGELPRSRFPDCFSVQGEMGSTLGELAAFDEEDERRATERVEAGLPAYQDYDREWPSLAASHGAVVRWNYSDVCNARVLLRRNKLEEPKQMPNHRATNHT